MKNFRFTFILLSILFVSIFNAFSQDENTYANLITKADDLYKSAWVNRNSQPDLAYNYAKEAYEIARDLDKTANTAKLFINLGNIFIVTKDDFNKAMISFKKANRICERLNDEKEAKNLFAQIQEGIGFINYKVKDYETAIYSYESALLLYTQLAQIYNISNCYHNLALIYDKKGDVKKAEQFLKKEASSIKRIQDRIGKKNEIRPIDENQMVKIDDYDAFE